MQTKHSSRALTNLKKLTILQSIPSRAPQSGCKIMFHNPAALPLPEKGVMHPVHITKVISLEKICFRLLDKKVCSFVVLCCFLCFINFFSGRLRELG